MAIYTKDQLSKKDVLELNAIGASEFGLKLDPDTMPKSAMVDVILDAAKHPTSAPLVETVQTEAQVVAKKKVRLVIHNQEGPDNTPFVAVNVNDYTCQIPREVEVEVPEFVLENLEHAVYDKPVFDEVGKQTGVVKAKRFPFSVRAA